MKKAPHKIFSLLLTLSLALAMIPVTAVAAESSTYVDGSWDGLPNGTAVYFFSNPNPHTIGEDAFATIGDALANTLPGGTVYIANGTYTGTGNRGLTIDKNVTIIGESQSGTIINAQDTDRIFTIAGGAVATIQNLMLTNGYANGGISSGIHNNGSLTLDCVTIQNCRSSAYGGGIDNAGTLAIRGSTIDGNTGDGSGGGIDNSGTLIIIDSTISNNNGWVGAIRNFGMLTIMGSTISNNNSYSFDSYGSGGIRNDGTLTIMDSTISNNNGYVGGIYNFGTLTITDSAIDGNTANSRGGGICNYSGLLTLQGNIDITNNAASEGGGIYNNGIYNYNSLITINGNVIIQGNTAANGGSGICNAVTSAISTITISSGGSITNYDVIDNWGTINNSGTIINRGTINNIQYSTGIGTITGTGTITDTMPGGTISYTYPVIFSVTGGNGSLSATVGSSAISTGAQVEQGKDIVFSAAPVTGYRVKEWKVNGNTVTGNTTNTYTIIDITVSHTVTVEFELIGTATTATPAPPVQGGADATQTPTAPVQVGIALAIPQTGDNSTVNLPTILGLLGLLCTLVLRRRRRQQHTA